VGLESARCNFLADDFFFVFFLKSKPGVPGECGVPGVLDPDGDPGVEPESAERFFKWELVLRMVMLRVTGT